MGEDLQIEDIKQLDWNEFVNEGFLQEANRQFFHPLGLALEVEIDDDGNAVGISRIWDYRDDAEGMLFGHIDTEKIQKVQAL